MTNACAKSLKEKVCGTRLARRWGHIKKRLVVQWLDPDVAKADWRVVVLQKERPGGGGLLLWINRLEIIGDPVAIRVKRRAWLFKGDAVLD